MTKQPAALRLADELVDGFLVSSDEVADELRRLHDVNQELLEALKLAQTIIGFGKEWDQIDAAIAKATGEPA